MLKHPGIDPVDSNAFWRANPDWGVMLEGLKTVVLPAIKAGAANLMHCHSGKFQGMIEPMTPIGSKATELSGASGLLTSGIREFRPFFELHSKAHAHIGTHGWGSLLGLPVARAL